MGIDKQSLQLLLHGKKFAGQPTTAAIIGRSTVTISRDLLNKIIYSSTGEKCIFPSDLNGELSDITKHSCQEFSVDDIELLHVIYPSLERVDIIDVSAYEQANVICDLNRPANENLHHKYDIIYDSSVSDNIFSPSQMYFNIHQMLRPGGLIMTEHHSSLYPGSLAALTPEWFYSFFACNSYINIQVYCAVQRREGSDRWHYDTDLYLYQPRFTYSPVYNRFRAASVDSGVCYSLLLAKKSTESPQSFDRIRVPINLQYLQSTPGSFKWDKYSFEIGQVIEQYSELGHYLDHKTLLQSDHFKYLFSGF